MSVQIEEGKCYRTRRGKKVGPMARSSSPGIMVGSGILVFADTGRQNRDLYRDTLDDIVAEWIDEPAPTEQQKNEPGWKQDGGKPRMDLIAPELLEGTAAVLTFGAAKYAERNWEKGMSWGRCFGALMRHLWAWWAGQKNDPETDLPHLWHAACCLMFLVAYEARNIGTDDRKEPLTPR